RLPALDELGEAAVPLDREHLLESRRAEVRLDEEDVELLALRERRREERRRRRRALAVLGCDHHEVAEQRQLLPGREQVRAEALVGLLDVRREVEVDAEGAL